MRFTRFDILIFVPLFEKSFRWERDFLDVNAPLLPVEETLGSGFL